MVRPNLRDPDERAAYRRELHRYGTGWRWLGLALMLAGLAVLLKRGQGFDTLSVALIAAGWAIWIPLIVARTRYHRRRMAEPEAGSALPPGSGVS